jgi:hypothetical protein
LLFFAQAKTVESNSCESNLIVYILHKYIYKLTIIDKTKKKLGAIIFHAPTYKGALQVKIQKHIRCHSCLAYFFVSMTMGST